VQSADGVFRAKPLQAKMLRLELLNVKADLERELGRLVFRIITSLHDIAAIRDIPLPVARRTGVPAVS
jgi:hypothetical protein